jgi:DNA primase
MTFKLPTKEQRSLLEVATKTYADQLGEVVDYLDSRGISPEVASLFSLGYVKEPLDGHEWFAGRLAIPYLTPTGPVAIRFRRIRDDEGTGSKYLGLPGAGTFLYNVLDLQPWENDFICITEGELDGVVLSGECNLPTLGIPGFEAWEDHWPYLLSPYENVYLFTDPDEAGNKLAAKLIDRVPQAIKVGLPSGKDVSECYIKYGADWLREKVGL